MSLFILLNMWTVGLWALLANLFQLPVSGEGELAMIDLFRTPYFAYAYLWVLAAYLVREELILIKTQGTSASVKVYRLLSAKALILWSGLWLVLRVFYWLRIGSSYSIEPVYLVGLNLTLRMCFLFFAVQWMVRRAVERVKA